MWTKINNLRTKAWSYSSNCPSNLAKTIAVLMKNKIKGVKIAKSHVSLLFVPKNKNKKTKKQKRFSIRPSNLISIIIHTCSRRQIQRQKCIVLSLCLIIVKDKWCREKKYYIFRPISPHWFIMPFFFLPPYLSNKKHISQKSPSNEKRGKIFYPFSAKNENHLRPFFALARLKSLTPFLVVTPSTQSFWSNLLSRDVVGTFHKHS